jgi:uncharacterized YigZ family protein
MDHYFTIDKYATAEFKDRGSKFIAYAFHIKMIDGFKQHLKELKKEHPKAVHHCFAYRLGLDGNNFRVNDDGEPSGTAGKPILAQIDSKNLTDILVVVVRYFGGTLLGVPGLINAYKTATSLVLQLTPTIKKQVEKVYVIHFDYTQINEVMTIVKQFNCTVIQQEMQLFCKITIGIPAKHLSGVLHLFKELKGVEISQESFVPKQ